jgi:hypothetical protein
MHPSYPYAKGRLHSIDGIMIHKGTLKRSKGNHPVKDAVT